LDDFKILVILLVLVVLILVSRGASNFTDIGDDKIGIAGDTSECEILCWECCRGQEKDCSETSGTAGPEILDCKCTDNYKEDKFKC